MADSKVSDLTTRGTPDRATDQIYVINSGAQYRSTLNNELGITGNPVGHTDIQTLTNKTLTSPTISSPVFSGTITGTYTIGGTPTFPSSVATLTGIQTLTNKTLTSPTLTSPTLTNASITQDSVVGFTTANSGTVYGVPFTSGAISGTSITAGTVGATQLSTGAITLGYAQITSNFTTTSTSPALITGLTASVTIPAGGRRAKITVWAYAVDHTVATATTFIDIWDGTVGSGTLIGRSALRQNAATSGSFQTVLAVVTPAAGAKTYNAAAWCGSAGTTTVTAVSTYPAFILAEAI